MRVVSTTVTQVRVFRRDTFDGTYALRTDFARSITQRYSFQPVPLNFGLQVDGQSLSFVRGAFVHEHKRSAIESLTIDQRRILFTLAGSSDEATAFYNDLVTLFQESFPEIGGSPDPLVVTEETATVVESADTDLVDALIDTAGTIQSLLSEGMKSQYSTLAVQPFGLQFIVRHRDVDPDLQDQNVTLLPKRIQIERRDGTPEGSPLFYIKSPTDSSTHLQIVNRLFGLSEGNRLRN